jgi:hypothetical protein
MGKPATFVPIDGGDPLETDEIAREIQVLGEELRARRVTNAPQPGLRRR